MGQAPSDYPELRSSLGEGNSIWFNPIPSSNLVAIVEAERGKPYLHPLSLLPDTERPSSVPNVITLRNIDYQAFRATGLPEFRHSAWTARSKL